MSATSLSERWRGRIDLEVGLASGAAAGVLATLALLVFWAHAGFESLEAMRDQCRQEMTSLQRDTPDPLLAIARVLEEQHHLVELRGPQGRYRSPGWQLAPGDLTGPLRWTLPIGALFAERWRVQESLPDGTAVTVAFSLAQYQHETGVELGNELLKSALAAWLGAALVGAFVAHVAMRPIRETTRALESISESRLDARMPLRGTSDPLDRHAEALNRMLARLEWAFGRLSAFSASAAHELRNPVNRILNVVDVALLQENDDAAPLEALQRVQASAQQLKHLVDSLLLLARGEEGRLPLARSAQDLRALLAKIVELYEPLASERGVAIALTGAAATAAVDARLIEHAVANLVDNALRYAPAGTAVTVAVAERGGLVEITVEDEGPGVPSADRERVFDRFVRLDAASTDGGIGLGLPIARMLAQLHGGDVTLGPGAAGGTRATLRLALGDAPAAAIAKATRRAPSA